MELLQWLNENDAGPIIRTAGAFGWLSYYLWLRFSSRRSCQHRTANSVDYGWRIENSAITEPRHLVKSYTMHQKDFHMSQSETLSHLTAIRERLANIEGRLGMYPPRRGVEPPVPELAEAPAGEESTQSGSTVQ